MNKTDEEDWGKLNRVLKYLMGMRELKLTLSIGDISLVKWWVDNSYTMN